MSEIKLLWAENTKRNYAVASYGVAIAFNILLIFLCNIHLYMRYKTGGRSAINIFITIFTLLYSFVAIAGIGVSTMEFTSQKELDQIQNKPSNQFTQRDIGIIKSYDKFRIVSSVIQLMLATTFLIFVIFIMFRYKIIQCNNKDNHVAISQRFAFMISGFTALLGVIYIIFKILIASN